ncbi:uncharacterized protein LOC113216037 isoform X1 [Frankliniella occidentalis]|uniref:Uncharacterized protein LOC113216037 isoform X1 n=1 Tax=Frankliniella occidentalis TaxID=133901 RepID=A0A6J1TE19_FRAOC|nr:uncharacterized protein LOC113216037 isoform X1 [Frankliniella occidentalis]
MSSKRKTAAFSEELNRVLGAGPPQKGKTSKQEVRTTIIEQSQSWGGVDVMEGEGGCSGSDSGVPTRAEAVAGARTLLRYLSAQSGAAPPEVREFLREFSK